MSAPTNNELLILTGEVDRIIFGPHPKNGFSIFSLRNATLKNAKGESLRTGISMKAKGSVAELRVGDGFQCEGAIKVDPKYGEEFESVAIYPVQPDANSPEGVASYLSDAMKGIGKTLAKRIVDHLGAENVFQVLDENPDILLEIKGITAKKLESINKAWKTARGSYRVMTFLRGVGIGPQLSHRVFMEMGGPDGADVVGLIKEKPYRLVNVRMVGFTLADQVALALGLPEESPERIEACALHILQKESEEGHTYLTLKDLGKRVLDMLNVDRALVAQTLLDASNTEDHPYFTIPDYSPVKEGWDAWVMLNMLHACEKGIVKHIDKLLSEKPRYSGIDDDFFKQFAVNNFKLDADQEKAARTTLDSKLSVITGGPGMGKTAIVKLIVEYLKTHDAKILQVAPTGRAAKQLKDSTGVESMTAHRFIGMAERAEEAEDEEALEELNYDVCIMDETSMTDTWLLYKVLKYLPPKTTLLLVGDIDQLASVGPGNVLGDLIDSGVIPVSRLSKVYRQGDGSGVAAAARNIIQGLKPEFTQDFRFTPVDDPYGIAKEVLRKVKGYLSEGIDISEIQVLSPMYKTEIGVTAMNIAMQTLFNPKKDSSELEVKIFDYTYRKGDKVLQTKNNIKKDIVNGDIGFITKIEKDDEDVYLHIRFDDRNVELKASEAENLSLAYAMTIHKSQGGQFQKVIMPMHTSQYIMLHRNIFYTGVTRAKEEVDIIGSKRAVNIAVNTEKNSIRQTGLKTALITHFVGANEAIKEYELRVSNNSSSETPKSKKSRKTQEDTPKVDAKTHLGLLKAQLSDPAPEQASSENHNHSLQLPSSSPSDLDSYEYDDEFYTSGSDECPPDYEEYESLFSQQDHPDMEP